MYDVFMSEHRKVFFTSGNNDEWEYYMSMITSEVKKNSSFFDWQKFSVSFMSFLNKNV